MADASLAAHKVCSKCGSSEFFPKGTCRDCSKAYAKANRGKIAAYQAAYRHANREKEAARREANRETARQKAKAVRAADPEKARSISREWYRENAALAIQASLAYRANNRDKVNATAREWRKANRDRLNAKRRAFYAENPQVVTDWIKAWREANPEKARAMIRASQNKWARQNPERARIHAGNRRARKKSGGGRLSVGLAQRLFKLQKGKCACCGKPLGSHYHLDHVVPLALGGPHEDGNIQLLRPRCNQQKSAKHPVEFMQERGFLL